MRQPHFEDQGCGVGAGVDSTGPETQHGDVQFIDSRPQQPGDTPGIDRTSTGSGLRRAVADNPAVQPGHIAGLGSYQQAAIAGAVNDFPLFRANLKVPTRLGVVAVLVRIAAVPDPFGAWAEHTAAVLQRSHVGNVMAAKELSSVSMRHEMGLHRGRNNRTVCGVNSVNTIRLLPQPGSSDARNAPMHIHQ